CSSDLGGGTGIFRRKTVDRREHCRFRRNRQRIGETAVEFWRTEDITAAMQIKKGAAISARRRVDKITADARFVDLPADSAFGEERDCTLFHPGAQYRRLDLVEPFRLHREPDITVDESGAQAWHGRILFPSLYRSPAAAQSPRAGSANRTPPERV